MSDALSKTLNYEFKNPTLLKIALTHRSRGSDHNERIEFLGDAVVNFVIADVLFKRFTKATEGELSRWRATLVNRETLADLAREFDLGQYIFLGPGEMRSGGSERESILSCAMEAIIGAVYLDGGFEAARDCIIAWYQPFLQSLSSAASHKDPKTVLQEYLQSERMALPVYKVDATEGEAHQQIFIVSCNVQGIDAKPIGRGTSRRRAEQTAAAAMLAIVNKNQNENEV